MIKVFKFILAVSLVFCAIIVGVGIYINQLSVSSLNAFINKQLPSDVHVELHSRLVVRLLSSPTVTVGRATISIHQESAEPAMIHFKGAELNLSWQSLANKRIVLDTIKAETLEYGNFIGHAHISDDYQSAQIEGTVSGIPIAGYTNAQVTGWLTVPFYYNHHVGEFSLTATDILFEGIDLDYLVCSAASRVIRKNNQTLLTNQQSTRLTDLSADGSLQAQKIVVNTFTARSGHNKLEGNATLNLNSDQAFIEFNIQIGNSEYCSALSKQLTEIQWPFSCKLTLSTQKPRCELDESFISQLINSRFQQEVKDKIDDVLFKLFKKD